jgi:phage baseplate assembly protein W
MNTPRYCCWRFCHPQLDEPLGKAGLQLSGRGQIETVTERSSVRQAILLLLSTRPGERVMRPQYGCDLHRLVFSPNDDTTAGLAIHYVRQAIELWEPRIDRVRLDAARSLDDESPGLLEISLEYRLRATLENERLVYGLNLTGEQA